MSAPDPELDAAAAAMAGEGARFVVIGGFALIANRFVRATEDIDFLVAGLRSIVGFKRLSDRPRDRNDLLGLAEIHGDLPEDPIPGLDS